MRDVNYTRDVHLHVGWWACVTCEQNLSNPWRWTTDVVVGGEPFTRPFSSLSLSKGYRNTLFLCTLSNWNSRLIPPAEMFRLAMVTFGDYTLFIYRLFLIDPTAVLAKLILTRWRNWPQFKLHLKVTIHPWIGFRYKVSLHILELPHNSDYMGLYDRIQIPSCEFWWWGPPLMNYLYKGVICVQLGRCPHLMRSGSY